jgi:hypothetical protein
MKFKIKLFILLLISVIKTILLLLTQIPTHFSNDLSALYWHEEFIFKLLIVLFISLPIFLFMDFHEFSKSATVNGMNFQNLKKLNVQKPAYIIFFMLLSVLIEILNIVNLINLYNIMLDLFILLIIIWIFKAYSISKYFISAKDKNLSIWLIIIILANLFYIIIFSLYFSVIFLIDKIIILLFITNYNIIFLIQKEYESFLPISEL